MGGFCAPRPKKEGEARRDCIRCEANIKLAGFPLGRRGNVKLQIHVRFVKRLVLRKTNVAVDPREIRTGAAGSVEARIELEHPRRKFFQQAPEGVNQSTLIALAVRVHPLLVVVAAAILEEFKCLPSEYQPLRFHGSLSFEYRCGVGPTGYTIPLWGQFIG